MPIHLVRLFKKEEEMARQWFLEDGKEREKAEKGEGWK